MIDLPDDEIGLAVISQITDSFDIQNIEDTSLFAAHLSSKSDQYAGARIQ